MTNIRTRRDPNGSVIVGSAHEPVLASKPLGAAMLTVYGGLHYIKGNRTPYFTLTGAVTTKRSRANPDGYIEGGCIHERILANFPDLADLAAMHLSSIDGEPMHAEANGWYNLSGATFGAFGERYHVGNSERHFPKAQIDPAKPWQTTDYRRPTHAEALQIFAEHIRAPLDEAERVLAAVLDVYTCELARLGIGDGTYAAPPSDAPRLAAKAARARWAEICAGYRERWAAEARACIVSHDLVIFGDGGLRMPEVSHV